MNVVTTEAGDFVELQGTGEEATFSQEEMESMLALARKGIGELVALQKAAIETVEKPDPEEKFSDLAEFFKP